MAEQKTKPTKVNVDSFIKSIADGKKRDDCYKIIDIMKKVTKEEPVMWGPTMVGFDKYHYKYASGHEGDSFMAGFSPRKQQLVVYIMAGFDRFPGLMERLGKYKTGKSCLYIKKLEDVDMNVLRKLITESYKYMRGMYK